LRLIFQDNLIQKNLEEKLFELFHRYLDDLGLFVNEGKIVDASFVEVIEHVFGFVTNSMNDFYIKCIGFQRAKGIIGLINLLYNMCRYEQIVRLNLLPIKKVQKKI